MVSDLDLKTFIVYSILEMFLYFLAQFLIL